MEYKIQDFFRFTIQEHRINWQNYLAIFPLLRIDLISELTRSSPTC